MEDFTFRELFEIKSALRAQSTNMRQYAEIYDADEWPRTALNNIESAYKKIEAIERGRIYGTDT